jgi:dTDP-glucose 4,6-dehydratase
VNVVVTGGAGFIGSALVRRLVRDEGMRVLTLDKLTYAGSTENLEDVADHPRHRFQRIDICDLAAARDAVLGFEPDAIVHLAAESHVDRSIDAPRAFVDTNVIGTYTMLQVARELCARRAGPFRFLHVSTDEVYGALGPTGQFDEDSPYRPNSPYSATKAASDHLARAWHATYGVPVVVTHCSNNFGPYQYPEKLVPVVILNASAGRPIPVYGDGLQVRDWLYVDDHVAALAAALERGIPGETYNIGADNELTNLALVGAVLGAVAEETGRPLDELLALREHVTDRPGHDRRYAIAAAKARRALDWRPATPFAIGMRRTVAWYLGHGDWCRRMTGLRTPPGAPA